MNELNILRTMQIQGHYLDIYGTTEEPLFLAVEVARTLDYSVGNTYHMLDNVDPREKILLSVHNNSMTARGNATQKWFLTEYGLYEVLMLSRKPIARRFKSAVKDILYDLRIRGEQDFEDWFEYNDPLVDEWEEINRNTDLEEEFSWEDFLRSKGYTDDMLDYNN